MSERKIIEEINPTFILMLQNEKRFRDLSRVAAKGNYLFDLTNRVVSNRSDDFLGSATYNSFVTGIRAQQALTSFVRPDQPVFTVPPDTTVAQRAVISVFNRPDSYELIDVGLGHLDIMRSDDTAIAEATTEIIGAYTETSGDRKIALAGVALMHLLQTEAESALVS